MFSILGTTLKKSFNPPHKTSLLFSGRLSSDFLEVLNTTLRTQKRCIATSIKTKKRTSSKLLVTGASGQVGQELVPHLRTIYGPENVIASDIREFGQHNANSSGPFLKVDVLDMNKMSQIVEDENIDTIVHLAALLSAKGEKNHELALRLNNGGTTIVLDMARHYGLKVFCPSTIGVFGPNTPKEHTPDDTITHPTTIYGISKVYMELLGNYYHNVFGVDFRSLRYPGVISSHGSVGGGTTDYAVEIFPSAIHHRQYTCFLRPDTKLPMIYMPDLLRATSDLLEADSLGQRVYNLGAMSFTPKELGECIQKYIPEFQLNFDPDFRQTIAESWPQSLDCSRAQVDWGWKAKYDLESIDRKSVV